MSQFLQKKNGSLPSLSVFITFNGVISQLSEICCLSGVKKHDRKCDSAKIMLGNRKSGKNSIMQQSSIIDLLNNWWK